MAGSSDPAQPTVAHAAQRRGVGFVSAVSLGVDPRSARYRADIFHNDDDRFCSARAAATGLVAGGGSHVLAW